MTALAERKMLRRFDDEISGLRTNSPIQNVKRWREGDQIEPWVGSGLLVAEQQFRKVTRFRQIPLLLSSVANAVSHNPIAKKGCYRAV
jgi:hypothetical protein